MTLPDTAIQDLKQVWGQIEELRKSIEESEQQLDDTKSAWARAQLRQLIQRKQKRIEQLKQQEYRLLTVNS